VTSADAERLDQLTARVGEASRAAARARRITLAGCALALVAALLLAVLYGSEQASLSAAIQGAPLDRVILFELRLPRALLAALAGAGLAAVGCAFQALLENPLAEPFVLGVSGGAAVGASVAIAIGLGTATVAGAALVPVAALAGGLAATWLVYAVARRSGQSSGTSILLAGVMVNSVAAALVTFLKVLVSPSRAQQLLRWLVGYVDLPSTAGLIAGAVYIGAGCAVLIADAGRLNLLALGHEEAATLGVDVRRLSRRIFLASSMVVGAIVSLTGLIGFVGLVVPHALRRLMGSDHRALLPASLLAGAAALTACDLATRLAFRVLGTELPVGAVTALVGGGLFLILLARTRVAG